MIPKSLAAPRVDGRCDDAAYQDALRVVAGRTPVRLVHSGADLYACIDSLRRPRAALRFGSTPKAGHDAALGLRSSSSGRGRMGS